MRRVQLLQQLLERSLVSSLNQCNNPGTPYQQLWSVATAAVEQQQQRPSLSDALHTAAGKQHKQHDDLHAEANQQAGTGIARHIHVISQDLGSEAGVGTGVDDHIGHNKAGSITEEHLSDLFDAELQHRLAAASAAPAAPSTAPDSAPATSPAATADSTQQLQPEATRYTAPAVEQQLGVAAPSSRSSPLHKVLPPLMMSPAAASWNPLQSHDPWAPLPSPSYARQRLPAQLIQLLQQTGVAASTAAAAVSEASTASSDTAGATASSSRSTRGRAQTTTRAVPKTSAISSSGSSKKGQAWPRRLFGATESLDGQQLQSQQLHQLQEQPQATTRLSPLPQQHQHEQPPLQHEHYLSILSRLQDKQLVSLLEECQAPSYGSKQVLLQQLVQLLQEQDKLQQQQQQQHFAWEVASTDTGAVRSAQKAEQDLESTQARTASSSGSVSATSLADASDNRMQTAFQQQQTQRQQQQDHDQSVNRAECRVPAALAAQQHLLQAVLDVEQIGGWLMAARAQDVCIVDVRGQAGMQTHLVVATGLNQRHTKALAEAVAWQLRQAARDKLMQQQQLLQQQQQQEQEGQGQADGASLQQLLAAAAGSNLKKLLPFLNVLGDASSDWCVLDAGSVVVHVLTERARRFYALEGLWGGPRGQRVKWLKPEQGIGRVETKDTIGRPAAL